MRCPGRAAHQLILTLNKDIVLPEGRKLTPAAVLVAFRADTGNLILTKRSARLKHHPGQIAFAGGKQDTRTPIRTAAALREAHEEIGLDPTQVQVIGALPSHETVTGYAITPVLAVVHGVLYRVPKQARSAKSFEVPFAHVINPAAFRVKGRHWQGTDATITRALRSLLYLGRDRPHLARPGRAHDMTRITADWLNGPAQQVCAMLLQAGHQAWFVGWLRAQCID